MKDLIEGLQIFLDMGCTSYDFQHDVMYAGPAPATVGVKMIKRLEKLGWYICDEADCFQHFN
jgi:hypothetical protein